MRGPLYPLFPGDTREGRIRLTWDDLMSRSPFNPIDWEKVAGDEWSGYQQVTVDGCTYLYMEP